MLLFQYLFVGLLQLFCLFCWCKPMSILRTDDAMKNPWLYKLHTGRWMGAFCTHQSQTERVLAIRGLFYARSRYVKLRWGTVGDTCCPHRMTSQPRRPSTKPSRFPLACQNHLLVLRPINQSISMATRWQLLRVRGSRSQIPKRIRIEVTLVCPSTVGSQGCTYLEAKTR